MSNVVNVSLTPKAASESSLEVVIPNEEQKSCGQLFLDALKEPKIVVIDGKSIPVTTTYYMPRDSNDLETFKIMKAAMSYKKGRKVKFNTRQNDVMIITVEHALSNEEINH